MSILKSSNRVQTTIKKNKPKGAKYQDLKRMSKNIDNKLTPNLRFFEFQNDGNWQYLNLGEIGEPLMCRRIFKEETTPNPNNGIPFYKIGTFGRLADSYISKEIYEEYKSKYSFPKIGDILISASGTIGRLVIYDGAPAYFQDSNIIWLGHNEDKILNSFLFYSYSNLKWQTSDGGVISRLYNSDFKRMKICFPQNEKEQQKIASCLSSLDEVITAESQKLEVLKEHKKGLLQNLFPQEGETVPNLRFPEFNDVWNPEQLSNLLDYERPDNYIVNDTNYTTTGTPVLTANKSFILGYTLETIGICKDIPAIIFDDFTVDNKYVEFPFKVKSSAIKILRTKGKDDLKFIFELMSQIRFEAKEHKRYYISAYQNLTVLIPKPKEQQKIALCLSSIDELITAQSQKIEALKLHKKGLLQGLFPKINE